MQTSGKTCREIAKSYSVVVTREGEGFAEVEQTDGDVEADTIGPLGWRG
jgi:hypothetical protein